MNYLSVGNIACDVLAKASSQQKRSARRTYLEALEVCPGGDALNSAVDAAAMGVNAKLIGCLGTDLFGNAVLNTLRQTNVDILDLRVDPAVDTSVSFYVLLADGEKTGAVYRPGGNEALCLRDVPEQALRWADHLHLGSPMLQDGLDGGPNAELLKKAREYGVVTSMDVVYDPDEIWLKKIEDALSFCDIFIPSDYEVEKICGTKDLQEMKAFFRPFGMKVFGVKRGKQGVFLTDFQQDVLLPSALKGDPKDTLGAGDAFFAAFNIAWHQKYSLSRCAAIASCASASVLNEYGASKGMVPFAELLKRADDFEQELKRR